MCQHGTPPGPQNPTQTATNEVRERFRIRLPFWTLFWSPGHRATMLEPQWKSMGSGAALALEEFDPYERYLVTYHLSDQAP